ncbi:hypothetical protein [Sulfitobacter sp. 1A12157]|uniref:hypothetical protein n=1 Tax=Sulfitobacter sp. 1A12157 TaxID=3368594 RepID=UPI0037457737
MVTERRTNVMAAACAAFFAFLYLASVTLEDWLTGNLDIALLFTFTSVHILTATMVGAAVSSWWFFPFLGKGSGARGIVCDLGWLSVAVLSAAAIAGTLVFPGLGTIGMPVFLFLQTSSSLVSILTLASSMTVALVFSRIRLKQAKDSASEL